MLVVAFLDTEDCFCILKADTEEKLKISLQKNPSAPIRIYNVYLEEDWEEKEFASDVVAYITKLPLPIPCS